MNEPHRTRLRRLQRRFAETPFEIPIAGFFAIIGIAGLVTGNGITPRTIDHALPFLLVQAWTVGLAGGGALTVAGRLSHLDRLEAVGLVFLGYGATLYAAVLLFAGNLPATLTAVSAMGAIALGCAIRVRVLTVSHRARTVATEIRGDGGDHDA